MRKLIATFVALLLVVSVANVTFAQAVAKYDNTTGGITFEGVTDLVGLRINSPLAQLVGPGNATDLNGAAAGAFGVVNDQAPNFIEWGNLIGMTFASEAAGNIFPTGLAQTALDNDFEFLFRTVAAPTVDVTGMIMLLGTTDNDPVVTDLFPAETYDQSIIATQANPASYQMQGTDVEDGNDANLGWQLDSFTGPFHLAGGVLPGTGNGAQSLSGTGTFSWDPTGSAHGFYFAGVTVTDSDGGTDTGILRVQVPEPGTIALASFALIGIVACRRRDS